FAYSVDDLTIHNSVDQDFFRVVALQTGVLKFDLSANSRFADLDLSVLDKLGDTVATVTPTLDTFETETVVIPAVAGEPYFARVFSQSGQFPSMNTFSLDIVNLAAPVPDIPDLMAVSDSGISEFDDLTNTAAPLVQVRVDDVILQKHGIPFRTIDSSIEGYRVEVYDDGTLVGLAEAVAGQPGNFQLPFLAVPYVLDEGLNLLTARVRITDATGAAGLSGESASLGVTLDMTAPIAPPAPDLVASSDSGGISDDDITTLPKLQFIGTGEPNRRIYFFADTNFVGRQWAQPSGVYEIEMANVQDGVYLVTTRQEDAAGNVGGPSPPLKITVAQHSLTLPGQSVGAAAGTVLVDLAAGTVGGYLGVAGATGKIGIVGIPTVNLETGGQGLKVLGTPTDNGFEYAPLGPTGGTLTRSGSPQVLGFTGVGVFTVDPLLGSDSVTVKGTTGKDSVKAVSDLVTTVQLNALLPIHIPTSSTELIGINTGFGGDYIEVGVRDTINNLFFVDAGPAATNPPNGDTLAIIDLSGKGKIQNFGGGPAENAGEVQVSYALTTDNLIIVDYQNVERVTKK
ncbi:MAG: hypothetical protein HYT80_00080, partial [Euryarchaeota archaeon]|nr:hypothetical protein [Euryarchaeota archaeon]